MDGLLFAPIVLPMLAGLLLLLYSACFGRGLNHRAGLHCYVGAVLGVSMALALLAAWSGERSCELFWLVDEIPVFFHIDGVGKLFVTVVSIVWLAVTVFAFDYMEHKGAEERFFGFWLLLYGVLVGLDFSGNLVTMYLFYEFSTLLAMPLVLHNGKRESVMAALKYLFYSLCGAYGGLLGIFFLHRFCGSMEFVPGGILNAGAADGQEGLLLAAVFVMILGFGAKAGMFPLHAWLSTAHPAAPSPASAALSAVIVKAGVLATLRTIYYVVGADFVRGTWVQTVWMTLTLLTVFMGSMLAFREQVFKKRLAYSTVSQVSYILFGLSLLDPTAFTGALFQVAVHAFAKCGLFLAAGVFLQRYGYTRVEQLTGIGKKEPKVLWCCLFLALGLVGMPPTGGLIGKWYLALGALESGTGSFAWLGPVVLLVSALLTAGYLLPVAMKGFFPGRSHGGSQQGDTEGMPIGVVGIRSAVMVLLPLVLLAGLTIVLGVTPSLFIEYISSIAWSVLG